MTKVGQRLHENCQILYRYQILLKSIDTLSITVLIHFVKRYLYRHIDTFQKYRLKVCVQSSFQIIRIRIRSKRINKISNSTLRDHKTCCFHGHHCGRCCQSYNIPLYHGARFCANSERRMDDCQETQKRLWCKRYELENYFWFGVSFDHTLIRADDVTVLILSERETINTLTYLLVVIMAFFGPNAEIMGNIKLSIWQFQQPILDITSYATNVIVLLGVELFSLVINGILLWKTCGINILGSLRVLQQKYWLLFAITEAYILLEVSSKFHYFSILF